jgi:CMP-N,N'-diacetyllegionaminic acid synthase
MIRILAVIPARGGSKGVPRKNIRRLNGKPLLQYTTEAALAAQRLTRVIVSTDDDEIAELGRRCGVEVPFLRPPHLAEDGTPMIAVVQHALAHMEHAGDRFDAVSVLQPTCPFRPRGEIDGCIETLERTGVDAVMTVAVVPSEYNPHWVYLAGEDGCLRLVTGAAEPIPNRQALPQAFHRDGSVYVTRRQVIVERHSFYGDRVLGCLVAPEGRVNIDTLDDWHAAERVLAEQTG